MNPFKVGDRVQFKNTAKAKSSWEAWFKRSFSFDTVITVYDPDAYSVCFKESNLPFITPINNIELAKGQMQLPFKGV